MEALKAELVKLGATVTSSWGELTVNGIRIFVETKEKGNKTQYEIEYKKKFQSPKNAAYYIMTEYLPAQRKINAMSDFIKEAKVGLEEELGTYSSGLSIYVMNNTLHVRCEDVEQLKRILKHLAANAGE